MVMVGNAVQKGWEELQMTVLTVCSETVFNFLSSLCSAQPLPQGATKGGSKSAENE